MSVTNLSRVVTEVYARGGFDLKTHDGCGVFTEAVVLELHRIDPAFGHLKKSGAQNQYHGHAVDAALYRLTGQSIDLIAASASPDARPNWGVDIPRYSDADWYAPVDAPPPVVVVPPVVPPPVPSVDLADILAHIAVFNAKLDRLLARKAPNYRTSLYGSAIVLKPDPPPEVS